MKRATTPLAVAGLAALLTFVGCARKPAAAPLTFPGAPLVLVSIDTLRSDHLPFYGYSGVETPALAALRKDSILFERAYSHAPLTLPAHASIFTGRLPAEHGARDNLGYRLKPDVPTLAELMKKAGYATGGAISAVVLGGGTGMGRGFDFYEDSVEPTRTHEATGRVQRPGDETEALLGRWLAPVAGGRFFAFLHLYEPHAPYEPAEAFRSRFQSPYDGEIATADAIVGTFLERLKKAGAYDRSLVILLSDHGEMLGEHGEDEHGVFLYRAALQVPLLVKLPGNALAGSSVPSPVQLADVFTTVCTALGIPGAPAIPGNVSLADLARGGKGPERRIFAETVFPRTHFGWSELASLLDGRFQYIEAPRPELYDLVADPGQRNDLSGGTPDPFRSFRIELGKRRAAFEAPAAVDAEEKKRLAALGYLSTGAAAAEGPLPDPKDTIGTIRLLNQAVARLESGNPKESLELFARLLAENPRMADVWELYSQALLEVGRATEALEARKKTVELSPPTATQPLLSVANLCLQIGQVDEAARHAQLARDRGDAAADEVMARVLLSRGDLAGAEAAARTAAGYGKTRRRALVVLARVQVARGALAEALATTDLVVGAAGDSGVKAPPPLFGLHSLRGEIYARMDRPTDAEAEFREEIRLFPASIEARVGLAVISVTLGRPADSRRIVAEMVAAVPNADSYQKGMRTLAVIGDRAGAEELRREALKRFPADPRLQRLP
ncbi:MAG: sulfatase-like hydrolase/transferase [Holophagales bacterium]|nr:sulfatase-like hydrolase/transferase [Holophagales bacterium]